jgi:short-subunit dehydrogenase
MILVARRNDRLEALESELKAINPDLEQFGRPLDLRDQAKLERFCDWLDESGLRIDLLINNAGMGDHGPFVESEWERVGSVAGERGRSDLPHLPNPACNEKGREGCDSKCGFRRRPASSAQHCVYAATKAYVISFSEGIRAELRSSNISVTALCPGPVETEFLSRATRGTARQKHTAPECFIVSVQEVVRQALEAVAHDRARVIPGITVNLAMSVIAFLPMFIKRLLYKTQAKHQPSVVPVAFATL